MDDSIAEVIITSSSVCSIYDATNSNEIASYKDENVISPRTLSLIGEDFLIGSYCKKPILKMWTISKSRKAEARSFTVPGKISSLAISNCGNYCIAGIKDQIYMWEVSTGDFLMTLKRHYQHVTCLKFTADDSRFFSGGKDGLVCVWILSCVIDVNARCNTLKPHLVWTKHSGEVTDIYCGLSVSRVATTSVDMTCNIYELDSGMLLSTICMDAPLTCVVMDPLEYYIFLGDEAGYLYKINTYEELPIEIHRDDMDNKSALRLHDFKIISLSVTFDGQRLLTVSEDICKLWHIPSMACVLNIRPEGTVTNAFLAVMPTCLTDKRIMPELNIQTFKKEITPVSENKYIQTMIRHQELSLMKEGCPDEFITSRIITVKATTEEETTTQNVFEAVINSETVRTVSKINQQLYTAHVDRAFGHLSSFGSPS